MNFYQRSFALAVYLEFEFRELALETGAGIVAPRD